MIISVCFALLCTCSFAACGGFSLKTGHTVANYLSGETKESAQSENGQKEGAKTDLDSATPDSYFRFRLLDNGTYEVFARYQEMPNRVVIPSAYNGKAVTKIGDKFSGVAERVYNRSVEEIVLPSSIEEIGEDAFYSYVCLRSITLPSTVRTIGEGAFMFCIDLTSITIPNGVQVIAASTFEECANLQSVTIPSTVNAINGYAFWFCEKLTSITFQGTKAQWNAIEKEIDLEFGESDWDRGTGNYTVHCTDGDVAKE